MPSKGHNLKKPKLAHPTAAPSDATLAPGLEPEKHRLTFAQHQHGQQAAAPKAVDQHEPARQELKSDAQQHQQKSGSHR